SAAYKMFPEQRLHELGDGQLAGNVIVDALGRQHPLDTHTGFDRRLKDYIVGKDGIALVTHNEIARGRAQTLEVLSDIFKRRGKKPADIITRFGASMTEEQVVQLRTWLRSLKDKA